MSRTTKGEDTEKRKKVGQYVLGPCLGEGSFAKVRAGTHIISKEKVAVKVISKRVIIRRDAARRNFRREALLLQHVCHPNIICLFEAMETPNSYYLVFELADNATLLRYITERQCLEEGESRHFFRQIVSALDHLHNSGIVHRNLKLENFMLTKNWDVKLVDFGLSALCQRECALHTQCGSPMYSAPEIFANRRYGPAVDLWSLGVCLYASVVGRLPFMPDPPTNLPLLHALILKGAVIPSFLSPGLQQLLTGLLEVTESRRLSITDLFHQSWLTANNSQPIQRFPPIAKAPPPSVDMNVVRYMSTMCRFSESDVIHSVTERKLNASSATYHMLKRHTDREKGVMGKCSSDDDSRTTSRDSKATETSEILPSSQDFRSNVFSNTNHDREPDEAGKNQKTERGSFSNYKECILYLKEARGGFSLSGKSFSNIHRNVGSDSLAVSGKSRDTLLQKLPLLNTHKNSLGNGFHGNGFPQAGNSHQCFDSMLQYLHPVPSNDVRLNVMGRPVLKRRGLNAEASLDSEQKGRSSADIDHAPTVFNRSSTNLPPNNQRVSFTSINLPKAPPPPPVPPNTAQGSRFYRDQLALQRQDISPRSSVSPPAPEWSLNDPFSRETWRVAFQRELRLVDENEAPSGMRGGGVAFVPPLSSPKALTSREESRPQRNHGYYLLRNLGPGTARNRNFSSTNGSNSLASRSMPSTHDTIDSVSDTDSDDNNDEKSDSESHRSRTADGHYRESLEKEPFLTPVIRVTITSTAKQ